LEVKKSHGKNHQSTNKSAKKLFWKHIKYAGPTVGTFYVKVSHFPQPGQIYCEIHLLENVYAMSHTAYT